MQKKGSGADPLINSSLDIVLCKGGVFMALTDLSHLYIKISIWHIGNAAVLSDYIKKYASALTWNGKENHNWLF